jgi:hypothetical protein
MSNMSNRQTVSTLKDQQRAYPGMYFALTEHLSLRPFRALLPP